VFQRNSLTDELFRLAGAALCFLLPWVTKRALASQGRSSWVEAALIHLAAMLLFIRWSRGGLFATDSYALSYADIGTTDACLRARGRHTRAVHVRRIRHVARAQLERPSRGDWELRARTGGPRCTGTGSSDATAPGYQMGGRASTGCSTVCRQRELPEGVPPESKLRSGARQGRNDFGTIGYGGPCPPPGPGHRYYFKLYALDRTLELRAGATRAQLDRSMRCHILAHAELLGRYCRR
jgi:hypothetical protein